MNLKFARGHEAARSWAAHCPQLLRKRLVRLRNTWAVLCVFALGVSSNTFANAMWDRLNKTPSLSVGWTVVTLLVSLLCFVGAVSWLYRHRHRILAHRARISSRPQEPRRVLIMGLSELIGEQQEPSGPQPPLLDQVTTLKSLLARIRSETLTLSGLARPRCELGKDYDRNITALPWLQNLRAIEYHRERIEQILVVPSKQSETQFPLFEEFVRLVIGNTPELAARNLQIASVGTGADFEDYNSIRAGVEAALVKATETAREQETVIGRGTAGRWWSRSARKRAYEADDISIDVTSGTKPFSIVAAVSTFGPDGRFLYVNNEGVAQSYNPEIRVAGGLISD